VPVFEKGVPELEKSSLRALEDLLERAAPNDSITPDHVTSIIKFKDRLVEDHPDVFGVNLVD
jgi:hypothetical protein